MSDYSILISKHGETLKNISVDKNITPYFYMTSCDKVVVNFDAFVHSFAQELSPPNRPKSCDALVYLDTDDYYFVEFKNGRLKEKTKNEEDDAVDIREKLLSSLLIILDFLEKSIKYSREKFNFILVYNPDNANKGQKSKNREIIKNRMYNFAKLRKYEKIFLKRISINTIAEFESEFVSKYCS